MADGWSWNVLLRELAACYAAALTGTDPQLPELPLQYADWAHWQHGRLKARRRELRRWWDLELDGAAPGLGPPADDTKAAKPGRTVTRSCDTGTEEALRALARREGVSLFAVLAAAFGAVIGRPEPPRGTGDRPAGRPPRPPGDRGLLGFLGRAPSPRVDLTGDPPFTELAHRMATPARRAFAHKDLPWEELPGQVTAGTDPAHPRSPSGRQHARSPCRCR